MTVPGGYIAGDVLTAANMNLLPGGKMGYAEVTADQTGISTSNVDLTSLTVTWTAVAARRYRTTVWANIEIDTSPTVVTLPNIKITDGSNNQKQVGYGVWAAASVGNVVKSTVCVSVVETGLSGSTTRKARGLSTDMAGGNGDTFNIKASATSPAWILVEDIGPA